MLTSSQKRTIKEVTLKLNPTYVGVFGSYARGEQHANSDLDILIDPRHDVDLLELIGVEQELSELLGLKVDLVTTRSLKPSLKPYVHADLIQIV